MALIHLDAGVVIGFLDGDDAHHQASRAVLAEALDQVDTLELSASALAECLVGPARRGEGAVEVVHELRRRMPITIVDLDVEIADRAARLRARHRSLRLPHALVIASAAARGADRLVTTDRRWPAPSTMGLDLDIRHL